MSYWVEPSLYLLDHPDSRLAGPVLHHGPMRRKLGNELGFDERSRVSAPFYRPRCLALQVHPYIWIGTPNASR